MGGDSHRTIISRSYRGLKIGIDGDLNTINRFMNLDNKIGAAVMAAQNRFMEEYKRALIRNLVEGGASIGIIQDSSFFISKKLKHGFPGTTGNMAGNLKGSITITKKRNIAFVGVPRNTTRRHSASSIMGNKSAMEYTVDEYAEMLERGSSKQPARPFFSNTFTMTMGGTRGLNRFIRKSIAQRLRIKY